MVSLALVLHAHQPVDNFDAVIEQAYASSYLPFIAAAEPRPWLRFTLHFSGWLLDWLAARHPDYLDRLRALHAAGRLELLGGGYFEPILAAIPDADKREQLDRLRDCIIRLFGAPPRGIWLTERVWEPDLPRPLAEAGAEFAVVDDTHLLMAGLEPEQTFEFVTTEHGGRTLSLLGTNQFLRVALPFRPETEGLAFLARTAAHPPAGNPHPLLAMGDDLEKFGSWPHTFAHVYRDGWLQRFFDGLEALPGQVETTTLSAYRDGHPPRRLVYLPAASYPEMMQWALPLPAAAEFGRARAEPALAPYQRFLAGAPWRSFLAKYPEANAMHKTAWDLSQRWFQAAASAGAAAPAAAAALAAARTHLLAAECNDAYWHGLFGGLYAPNLRDGVYTRLLAADRLLAAVAPPPPCRRGDFHHQGRELLELRSPRMRVVADPADGGTISELDFLPADANLINSLRRRPEVYHAALRARLAANPAGLPGAGADPAADWAAWLQYDRYAPQAARLYRFAAAKTHADYLQLNLEEDPVFAAGAWSIAALLPQQPAVRLRAPGAPMMEKWLGFEPAEPAVFHCYLRHLPAPPPHEQRWGLEMIFNLLAPAAPDRCWLLGTERQPLDWSGVAAGEHVALEDGWRRCRIELQAPGAAAWWVRPIWTVSQSEGGAERVYQGSAALAVWPQNCPELHLATRLVPLP